MRALPLVATPLLVVSSLSGARADPCGMVPPIWTGTGPAIMRVGEQMTYAFFSDGIETIAIRPGFSGKVDNFGMLIPFPTPPAIRKIPDEIFQHIGAAIDPPEVVIDLRPPPPMMAMAAQSAPRRSAGMDDELSYDSVKVLRQEAVGMYEVAVLEAGSARALRRWLDANGYVYPDGMDEAVGEYVAIRWAFVAVKTRVGSKPQITPRPGMRTADPKLPTGSSFDGKVQAMGFRFRIDEPVVPMRLSAFNEGHMRNIVYFLTDRPMRIRGLDKSIVKRQLSGRVLQDNLTLLPVRILGGDLDDVSPARFNSMAQQRDPVRANGHARDLFASDLLAARRNKLSLAFEEREKVLLNIGEALRLRGPAIDALHHEELTKERKETLGKTLGDIKRLTITVIDGDFPRQFVADQNLTFVRYVMPKAENGVAKYNARTRGPSWHPGGVLVRARWHPGTTKGRWREP